MDAIIVIVVFFLSWAGTHAMEILSRRLGLIQAPNERSSHTIPTARGGGVAIAAAAILAAALLALDGDGSMWAVVALTSAIAVLGFADDLYDLSPLVRFPLQTLSFGLLIWAMPPLPPIDLPAHLVLVGVSLALLVLLVGVWWLNLFNFMDGIDGLAASQAILILCGAALIWWIDDASTPVDAMFWLALVTAAATAGFLLRNWPPAHIFMGDSGSNALALIIFAIALATITNGKLSYETWIILPALFVSDATITLLRRSARGEKPWRAHRRHAYQQMSRRWGHRAVTLLYGGLTLLWTVPLALSSQLNPALSWGLVLLAYLPLVALMLKADAGGVSETAAQP